MDPKLGAHANASATTTCSRICEVHLGAASVLVANWQLEELLLREQQHTNRDHKKKSQLWASSAMDALQAGLGIKS